MCGLWRGPLARLPTCYHRKGARLASFDEREDAGEMEKANALDSAGFANGDGSNKSVGRPLVEHWTRAAGVRLMPALWCPDPNRQVSIPLANKLCSARLSGSGAGGRSPDTQKIFLLTVHKFALRLIWERIYAKQRQGGCITYTEFRPRLAAS